MNTQEIAESLSKDDPLNYNKEFKRSRKKLPWLHEFLRQGYVSLHNKVKIHTRDSEWLPWEHSCKTLDQVVLSVSYVYEKKITSLEREINDLKHRLK